MDRSHSSGSARQAAVAGLVAAVLLFPTLGYGFGFDHGFMQYVGRGLLHGMWPYVDTFDTSFPAVYVLHMAIIAIGGESVLAVRIADLLIQIVTALLLFAMARRIAGPRAGLIAAALYAIAYTNGTYYHTAQRDGYLTPCLLASMWGVWIFLDDPTRLKPLILAALAAGLGCLFRPTYALLVALGAVALVLYRPRVREPAIFAGVAALPMLAFFAFYLVTGHGGAIADLLTFASKVYVALERQTKAVVLQRLWEYVPLTIWLGVALTFVAVYRGWFGAHRRELATIAFVVLGCVLIRLWESKAWRYQYWPPLAVLALTAGLGWSFLMRNRATFIGVTVVVLGAALGRTGLARYGTVWSAMAPSYAHTVADSPDQAAMAEYLATHTRPGDAIQMWGPETIVLFASGRRSATRFVDTNMFFCPDPQNFHHLLLFTDCGPAWNKPIQVRFFAELVDSLTAHPPAYIAAHYADGSMAIDTTYCLAPDVPALRQLIDQRYQRAATFGPWSVFRLSNP
jgi:dolichyl-phosphate-mannose-protein mannosyltransferase